MKYSDVKMPRNSYILVIIEFVRLNNKHRAYLTFYPSLQELWVRVRGGRVRLTEGDVRDQEHHLLGQQELPVQEQERRPQGDWRHDGKLPRGLPHDGLHKEHSTLDIISALIIIHLILSCHALSSSG